MKQHKWYRPLLLFCSLTLFSFLLLAFSHHRKNAFNTFCNQLFAEEVSKDTLGLHYTLAHPENYGITQTEATLPSYEKSTSLNDYKNLEEYCRMLNNFESNQLSVEEQYTQKLLLQALNDELQGKQYFYLQEVFSPSGGIQMQYPILMAEYTFRSLSDIEDYLALLKQTPDYFNSYCQFTSEKAQRGFCMPDYSLKKVIEQCRTIITEKEIQNDSHFLITTFDERLETAVASSILSNSQAEEYRRTNKEYLSAYVLPAYTELAQSLSAFLGMGKNEDGLSYYPDGQAYYSWLFQQTTGSAVPLDEVYQTLAADYYDSLLALQEDLIAFQNTSSLTDEDFTYFTLTDSYTMLEDLTKQMDADFPSISTTFHVPSFAATVKDVSTSLEKFTAPAYYMVPPLDDLTGNSIYINQAASPQGLELYTTLAHEGYPGHLYQTAYYQLYREKEKLPLLRSTLNYSGYVEGWALYVELLSYEYAAKLLIKDTGKAEYSLLYDIYKQERRSSLSMLSLLDVGIHYYGLTFERAKELLKNHGITQEAACREIYEYIVEEPATYPKYYWSYLEILSLKEEAKSLLKDRYNDYTFHQCFLESGPSDFSSLRERLLKELAP